MNTVNTSIGYSGFQLCLGQSPCIVPPIVPSHLSTKLHLSRPAAKAIIVQLQNDVADVKDNLLLAKIAQAHYARTSHPDKIMYNVGNKVMLSKYKQRGEKKVAKFFPRWDGPYMIVEVNAESSYTLGIDNGYPYYSSELKLYHANDPENFLAGNTLSQAPL